MTFVSNQQIYMSPNLKNALHPVFVTAYFDSSLLQLMQAFENLLQRELISFADNRGYSQSVEFRPVKLLISHVELHQGLKSYRSCPVS